MKRVFNFDCFALLQVSPWDDNEPGMDELDAVTLLGFYLTQAEADAAAESQRATDLAVVRAQAEHYWKTFRIRNWEEAHPCRDAYVVVTVSALSTHDARIGLSALEESLQLAARLQLQGIAK